MAAHVGTAHLAGLQLFWRLVVELEPEARVPVLAGEATAASELLDDEQTKAAVPVRGHRAWTGHEAGAFVVTWTQR